MFFFGMRRNFYNINSCAFVTACGLTKKCYTTLMYEISLKMVLQWECLLSALSEDCAVGNLYGTGISACLLSLSSVGRAHSVEKQMFYLNAAHAVGSGWGGGWGIGGGPICWRSEARRCRLSLGYQCYHLLADFQNACQCERLTFLRLIIQCRVESKLLIGCWPHLHMSLMREKKKKEWIKMKLWFFFCRNSVLVYLTVIKMEVL